MKKKILFLITKATWGGAQRYVHDLATNLPKERFEAIVAFGTSGKLARDLDAAGIKTRHLPSLGRDIAFFSDLRSFFEILRALREIRPDIIHLNSSKAAALGALAARVCRVPKIVFTVHGWPFKEPRGVIAQAALFVVSWITAYMSHATIVVSRSDYERGRVMWGIARTIHYISLGIASAEALSREVAEMRLAISPARLRIVTIAELTKNKGITHGLDAIAELKRRGVSVSYSIIGEGEERNSLEKKTQSLAIASHVHFLGFIPDASRYLAAFDVFLLPSIKEGMPYVVLEAAAAGLPIVATDATQDDMSLLPNTYTVRPGSGHALADAIERLSRSMPRPLPRARPSLAQMLEKTMSLYEP